MGRSVQGIRIRPVTSTDTFLVRPVMDETSLAAKRFARQCGNGPINANQITRAEIEAKILRRRH
jgi:hypothetical protein